MPLTYLDRIQQEFPNLKPNQEDSQENSDDWLNNARALLRNNQLAEAEQQFKACVVAEPDLHGGFEGLAEIYRQQGRVAEARYFQQQALMRARRFINDGSMDQEVFDEIFAAYKSTDTQAYTQRTTTELVKAMAQSMAHPDSALLQAILKRGAEAVPHLREALREDVEVTWVSDFAAQLLATLKLNGVNEAAEAIPELVDIFRRTDEDALNFLMRYLGVFGAEIVPPLIEVVSEAGLNWYQRGMATDGAIAAAGESGELRAEIASTLRQQLAEYVARKETDIEDPNVASLISSLVELRDKASLPLMQQAFALELADESMIDEDALPELELPSTPLTQLFDTEWLRKHELSLLNAVHQSEDDDPTLPISPEEVLHKLSNLFPNLHNPVPEQLPYVAEKKPGRNDPCWCGSGKKYKHCHLREDEAKLHGT